MLNANNVIRMFYVQGGKDEALICVVHSSILQERAFINCKKRKKFMQNYVLSNMVKMQKNVIDLRNIMKHQVRYDW